MTQKHVLSSGKLWLQFSNFLLMSETLFLSVPRKKISYPFSFSKSKLIFSLFFLWIHGNWYKIIFISFCVLLWKCPDFLPSSRITEGADVFLSFLYWGFSGMQNIWWNSRYQVCVFTAHVLGWGDLYVNCEWPWAQNVTLSQSTLERNKCGKWGKTSHKHFKPACVE